MKELNVKIVGDSRRKNGPTKTVEKMKQHGMSTEVWQLLIDSKNRVLFHFIANDASFKLHLSQLKFEDQRLNF